MCISTVRKKIFLSLLTIPFILFTACKKDPPPGPGNPNYNGIEGTWQSSGENVSSFLKAFAGIDSVYAEFNANLTYRIEHFDGAGEKTTLSGTYDQIISDTTDFFYVRLDQISPDGTMSEGIAAVYVAQPDSFNLEVVQTIPYIGAIPPKISEGFGSSSEGALGNTNIQRFRRIED